MSQPNKPFEYLKTTIASFSILAAITFATLGAADHAYSSQPDANAALADQAPVVRLKKRGVAAP